jgi:serine/threonine-protein kinase
VTQVAAALDAAHGAGLVHRDVKPANVLVSADDHVYLTDFGLAQHVRAGREGEGGAAGTAGYIAPEVAEGAAADPRSDIYALGSLLFFALTATTPGADDARVPAALDPVIARALAREPGDRYASAGELAGAARAAVGVAHGATRTR